MRNTKLTLLTLLGTILLIFSSCEKDANFVVTDGDSKLHVVSEITPSEKIVVYVKTSVGANTDDKFIYPKQGEARIVLFEEGIALENPGFRYISSQKAFVSQGAFRPKVGLKYSLEVTLLDNEKIRPIFGSTTIPEADSLVDVSISNVKTSKWNADKKTVSLDLDFNFNATEHKYFLLKVAGDLNGEHANASLGLKDIINRSKGTYYSQRLNGVLVDKTQLDTHLSLRYETLDGIEIGQEFNKLNLELRTITKEAYQFYVAYSKQITAEQVAISEPVISYSNFDNGLGLFSGYSASIIQVQF